MPLGEGIEHAGKRGKRGNQWVKTAWASIQGGGAADPSIFWMGGRLLNEEENVILGAYVKCIYSLKESY